MDRTIDSVLKSRLCTGCGACIGLCPNQALELTLDHEKGIFLPKLNKEKCTRCSICYQVCAGSKIDFELLNEDIFGKKPENVILGNYLNCYTGHAADSSIRYKSASGGIVTQLLLFALEAEVIDGALVARMKRNDPLKPECFIAKTKNEIIEASGSRYCPVPTNVLIRKIVDDDGRFAVVGLPCHIHGVRKAELINKKLKEKIVLHLGLFCHHVPSFHATELLLQRLGIRKNEIAELQYRGEGWPGSMKILLKGGAKKTLPYQRCWDFLGLDFFIPARCLVCSDGLNELADLSCGDAWLPEFSNDSLGTSILLSRNNVSEGLLKKAVLAGRLELDSIPPQKVIQSQLGMLYFKKNVETRIRWLRRKIEYSNSLEPSASDYLYSLFVCMANYIFSKQALRQRLGLLPMEVFYAYAFARNMFARKERIRRVACI